MKPGDAPILRMRSLPVSAMNNSPAGFSARPLGWLRVALVAGKSVAERVGHGVHGVVLRRKA